MNMEETLVSTQRIYEGCVLNLRVDDIRLPDGAPAKREIVEHSGAVCVLPLTADKQVYMVRQFRYAFQEVMLEIPAGKLNSPTEDHEAAVLRELEEETGMKAGKLIDMGLFRPSVAIITEVIHMYLATDLIQGQQHPDEDEFLEVVTYPFEKVLEMVMSGEIKDGKTIAAVLKASRLLSC